MENRTWATTYRGPLVVHAGKKYDHDGHAFIENELGLMVPKDLPCGGIVGMFELVDCVTSYRSKWFFGPYGFVVGSPTPLSFMEYPGKLGFMDIPDEIIARLSPPLASAAVLS